MPHPIHTLFVFVKEPKEIILYDNDTGEPDGSYQYVPLLSTLENLLAHEDVRSQVAEYKDRMRSDDIVEDFCDGQVYKSHPLFSNEQESILIMAHYDELELCNPLGTHVKQHKTGIVFFTLGNFHPKYRSSLKAINLAICCRYKLIQKYGMNKILTPFVEDLDVLYNHGVSIDVKGKLHVYKGALIVFLADNLASHLLGGFKLSFSFAYRSCRTCLVPTADISSHVVDNACVLRNTESHIEHCNLVESPARDHSYPEIR